MRRFTIAGLMAAVLLFAVALAALRFASELWAGIVLLLAIGLLATSALGVAYRRDAARAGWLGFLLFGGAYTTLAFAPWFAVEVAPKLPTTPLLAELNTRLNPPQEVEQILVTTAPSKLGVQLRGGPMLAADSVRVWKMPTNALNLVAASGVSEHFHRVGHGLFAILFGLVGAVVARRFQRTAPV